MNKIFKVVWNKARGCYVVASEFAKSCTKSGRTVKAVAVAAAAALTLGVNGMALADIPEGKGSGLAIGTGSEATTSNDTAVGENAKANGEKYELKQLVNGQEIVLEEHEGNATAIGANAKATGANSTAVGVKSEATTVSSTAIGMGAKAKGAKYITEDGVIHVGNATAVGVNAQALGADSTALGVGVKALAYNSTALGIGSRIEASSTNSTAIGNAKVGENSENSVAIGNGARVGNDDNKISARGSTAVGTGARATKASSTALGVGALADGVNSIALSNGAKAYGMSSTALGHLAVANNLNSMAVGAFSGAYGDSSIAAGHSAKVYGYGSVGIGHLTIAGDGNENATTMYAIAVGDRAHATDVYSIAVGYTSRATGDDSIAQGRRAVAFDDNTIAIGYDAQAGSGTVNWSDKNNPKIINDTQTDAQYAMAIGYRAKAYAQDSLAMGHGAEVKEGALYSSIYGTSARAYAQHGTAIGYAAQAGSQSGLGNNATAVGYKAKAFGESSVALGDQAESYGTSTIAIGTGAKAGVGGYRSGYYTVAIGDSARAYGANSVALGANSTDKIIISGKDYATVGGYAKDVTGNIVLGRKIEDYTLDTDNKKIITSVTLEEKEEGLLKYSDIKDFAGLGAVGTVSIGSAGNERTIMHVAAGRIAADSTDAINGSQLYLVAKDLKQQIDDMNEHYHTVNGNKTQTGTGNATTGGDTGSSTNTNTIGAGSSGSSTTAGTAPTGDKPTLDGEYAGNDGNLSIKYATDDDGKRYYDISMNSDLKLNSVTFGDTVVNKGGMKFDETHYVTNNEIKMGDTVINDNSVKVGDTINIDNSTKNISVGKDVNIDMGGNQIHNVAAGTADTDAVNYGQLKQVEQNIANNSVQINKLGDRIDKVGAGAAALAALHPLDFDPDDKFYLSAGYGNYRGENAAAIGAFYQPNDDTLFSVSSTVGNDDDMINAGVTWRFGQSSNQSRSKKAMAKEIIELRTEVAELKAMVYNLTGYGLDLEKTKVFPDTPENHWAYDYVAVAAGNGILEGYPDGQFDGSKPMTRYEMAAVVYRLLQKGAQVDNRMLLEFAPELARIKVDTVTKYKDGTPHIQRVRVINGRG